jgi:hypothetical protein
MHGGLLNGSEVDSEGHYRSNSINADDDDRREPLL